MSQSFVIFYCIIAVCFDVANARATNHNVTFNDEDITYSILWHFDDALTRYYNEIGGFDHHRLNEKPLYVHGWRITVVLAYVSSIDERLEIFRDKFWSNTPSFNYRLTDVWYAVAIGRKVE